MSIRAALAALLFMSATASADHIPDRHMIKPQYTYAVKLLRVVDGDTVDVLIDLGFHITVAKRVRLVGVDAPELFGAKAVPEGKEAKVFVEEWFRGGAAFTMISFKYDDKDKYGRALGLIFRDIDTVSLNRAVYDRFVGGEH